VRRVANIANNPFLRDSGLGTNLEYPVGSAKTFNMGSSLSGIDRTIKRGLKSIKEIGILLSLTEQIIGFASELFSILVTQ
jgi:hypothetical protein